MNLIEKSYVVLSGIRETGDNTSPDIYRGIKPDISPCAITADRMYLEGGARERALSDGDMGPTDSVDVSNPDQVTRLFVWHQDNGSGGLYFSDTISTVSYIDVYFFLNIPKYNHLHLLASLLISARELRLQSLLRAVLSPPLPIH